MTIEYLLRRAATTGDLRALRVARRSLDAMADGGIHDQLGGGFHRYATDAIWLVPHFEQMLYDNAQLARVYIHAWQLTGDRAIARSRRALSSTWPASFVATTGLAASQDADTRGRRCDVHLTAAEIRGVLGADAPPCLEAYGVTDAGNWEGTNILSRSFRRPATRPLRWVSPMPARDCSRTAGRDPSRPATTRAGCLERSRDRGLCRGRRPRNSM